MKGLGAVTWALALAACGPNGSLAQEHGEMQIEAVPDSEIPVDGSVHVVRRGQFVIGPETHICVLPAQNASILAIDGSQIGFFESELVHGLDAVFERNGKSKRIGDFARALSGESAATRCSGFKNPINIQRSFALNRNGKPYRLTLTVRQGDALWQGVVERPYLPECPDGVAISPDGMCNGKPYWNVSGDALALSRSFVQTLTSKD